MAGLALSDGAIAAPRERRSGGRFNPLGFPGDDSVITNGVTRTKPVVALRPASGDRTVKTDSIPVEIWQVQFFATTDFAEAAELCERAGQALTDTVSVEYETPYYKVRAGHFADRGEAEALMIRLRAMGYESAWIVRREPE